MLSLLLPYSPHTPAKARAGFIGSGYRDTFAGVILEQEPIRPHWQVGLEAASVACASLLLVVLASRTVSSADRPEDAVAGALGVVAGIVAADLLSGIVHWFCDTFFREDTPVLGPALIAPFRDHHRDPQGITRHGFLELNGNNCLGVSLLAGTAIVAAPAHPFATGAALGMAAALAVTNLIHCWAHAAGPPAWVVWMQARGILLSPHAHALHHREGRGSYCITTGWMSESLDRSGVLVRIERAVHGRP